MSASVRRTLHARNWTSARRTQRRVLHHRAPYPVRGTRRPPNEPPLWPLTLPYAPCPASPCGVVAVTRPV